MDYNQAFFQLGHAIVLGMLLMLLTMWISQRAAKLQAGGKEKKNGASNENTQGAINVLFFCFGMTGIMILVGDNIARAFAIGAAIALVRFRVKMGNSLLSSAFLFSVVIGMACGVNNVPVAWSIATLYALVALIVSVGLSWRSSPVMAQPAPDLLPGQLYRDAKGNWTCYFPRYTATIDGVTGNLIGLSVNGEELMGPQMALSPGTTDSTQDGDAAVAEFDSLYTGRSGLSVSHRGFNIWWHFFADSMVLEYMTSSSDTSEMMLLLSRNVSALSRPYPARSRHLSEVARKDGMATGEVGVSAVTRKGTPIVFLAPNPRAAGQPTKRAHGITFGGNTGVRWAAEIQIGHSTQMISVPDMS